MANRAKHGETEFHVGDTVAVRHKFKEADKTRSQTFEGIVIAIKGRAENKSFTIRKMASARVGVERIWPLLSPAISKITVKKKGKVRRAKLYYLKKRAQEKG